MSDALNLEPGALVGGYTLMSRVGTRGTRRHAAGIRSHGIGLARA